MHYDLRPRLRSQPGVRDKRACDQVVGPDFLHTCEVAFTNRAGPVVLPGAGHFLQWERAELFNPLVIAFFGDVRVANAR